MDVYQYPRLLAGAGQWSRIANAWRTTGDIADLGLRGKCRVRDLWRQKDLGVFEDRFEAAVLVHGVVLVRIYPMEKS